jgi:hypothetical protein
MRTIYKYELVYSGWMTDQPAEMTTEKLATHRIVQSGRGNVYVRDCLRRAFCAVGASLLYSACDLYGPTVTIRIFPAKEKDVTMWEHTIHIPHYR